MSSARKFWAHTIWLWEINFKKERTAEGKIVFVEDEQSSSSKTNNRCRRRRSIVVIDEDPSSWSKKIHRRDRRRSIVVIDEDPSSSSKKIAFFLFFGGVPWSSAKRSAHQNFFVQKFFRPKNFRRKNFRPIFFFRRRKRSVWSMGAQAPIDQTQ